jgi:hypothetical protein
MTRTTGCAWCSFVRLLHPKVGDLSPHLAGHVVQADCAVFTGGVARELLDPRQRGVKRELEPGSLGARGLRSAHSRSGPFRTAGRQQDDPTAEVRARLR